MVDIASAEIYLAVPAKAQARLSVYGYISKAASGALVHLAVLPSAILDYCECVGAVNSVILTSGDNRYCFLIRLG